MFTTWIIIWMLFMFIFLLTPVSYGWGYRRWGFPYPRYYQKRRGERLVIKDSSENLPNQYWGWIGDMVWIVLLIGIIWAIILFGWN